MDKEHVGMNVLTPTDSPFQFLTLLLERHKAQPIGMNDTVETVQVSTTPHALIVEGRTGVQVMGDADRLGQVFVNLFTNAIKYPPGAPIVRIHLSREGEPDQAIVSVQDDGIGLYISGEIVSRHQGRLWVESRKGEGSTFFVALPILSPEVQEELE